MNKRPTQIPLRTFASLVGLVVLASAAAGQALLNGNSVLINKRPLRDFGHYAKSKIESRSVDLDAPFSVVVTGKIDKSGKFDPATVSYTKTAGDKGVVELVKKAIESINESGYLSYLVQVDRSQCGTVTISAAQDESSFTANVTVETATESRARTIASGLQMLVQLAGMKATDGSLDKDEQRILNSTVVSADGKLYVVKMGMPRSEFREMIERKLAAGAAVPKS